MKRARDKTGLDPQPPTGAIEMTCHLFADDPVQFRAYATFTARVDSYLSHRGFRNWAALNVRRFIQQSASTATDAGTMCCMLAKLLPWMVCAGDMSREAAREKLTVLAWVGRKDKTVRASVAKAVAQLDDTEASVLEEWLH